MSAPGAALFIHFTMLRWIDPTGAPSLHHHCTITAPSLYHHCSIQGLEASAFVSRGLRRCCEICKIKYIILKYDFKTKLKKHAHINKMCTPQHLLAIPPLPPPQIAFKCQPINAVCDPWGPPYKRGYTCCDGSVCDFDEAPFGWKCRQEDAAKTYILLILLRLVLQLIIFRDDEQ